MKKRIKKIKESIGQKHYDLLQQDLKTNNKLRLATKRNLSRIYCNCFYTGVRLNENQGYYKTINGVEYRIGFFAFNIKELYTTGITTIILSKQLKERKLFLTPNYKKDIEQYFDLTANNDELIVSKGSNTNNKSPITIPTLINQVNKHMKSVLGKGFTSHSFRQGVLSEYGRKGVHAKIVQGWIGHANIAQTIDYFKVEDNDIRDNLIR